VFFSWYFLNRNILKKYLFFIVCILKSLKTPKKHQFIIFFNENKNHHNNNTNTKKYIVLIIKLIKEGCF